jgi:hypothetical protein
MAHLELRSKYIRLSVRIIAMVALVSLAVIFLSGAIYIFIHAGHDCAVKPCSLCPFILGKQLIEHVGRVVAVVGVLAVAAYAMRNLWEWFCRSLKYPVNLIEFNIRMNN